MELTRSMARLVIAIGVTLTAVVIREHVVEAIIDEQLDEVNQKPYSSG